MSDTRCPVRAEITDDGRWAKHVPQYDTAGQMVTTDEYRLRSKCGACGATIARKHTKSSWWHECPPARPLGEPQP